MKSFKKGDKVIPSKGPHKGQMHRVIHAHDDGEHYNIQPIGIKGYKIKYRLGAAKAHHSDLKNHITEAAKVNDWVHVTSGPHKGKSGRIGEIHRTTMGKHFIVDVNGDHIKYGNIRLQKNHFKLK